MSFPQSRGRRLRRNASLRRMMHEVRLSLADFISPIFVSEGAAETEKIPSMPGVVRFPCREAAAEAVRVFNLGLPAVLLFGIPRAKDSTGSEALKADGIVQRTIAEIKSRNEKVLVMTDICACEYTDHGHCGVIRGGQIDNDATIKLLAEQALSHARAGADVVAPSAMMDGQVQAIRSALDGHGFEDVAIMSYSAKYSSAFYGPFRDAAQSSPRFGDRKDHQMNPANSREALREISLDIDEGTDIVMIKPALAFLDVISRARETFNVPIAAYNVSGEYAMVKAMAMNGWADERSLAIEILTAIKRAGADLIISYHAPDLAGWLSESESS